MQSHKDKSNHRVIGPIDTNRTQRQNDSGDSNEIVDNRPETITQRKLQEAANNSPQSTQTEKWQELADNNLQLSFQHKSIQDLNGAAQKRVSTNDKVSQLIRAHRVGTSASKYKITVADGQITEFKGGSTGIDISFGNEIHAEYYFNTKKKDTGTEMVSWDFPDNFYNLITVRMKGANKKKNWNPSNMWKAIWNLKAPVNSSDSFVTKGGLIAPHFSKEWIPPLNKYGKGSNAKVTTYEDFFGGEESSEEALFNDDVLVFMYKQGAEKSGLIIEYGEREDYTNGEEDWLYASQSVAVEKGWAENSDFTAI